MILFVVVYEAHNPFKLYQKRIKHIIINDDEFFWFSNISIFFWITLCELLFYFFILMNTIIPFWRWWPPWLYVWTLERVTHAIISSSLLFKILYSYIILVIQENFPFYFTTLSLTFFKFQVFFSTKISFVSFSRSFSLSLLYELYDVIHCDHNYETMAIHSDIDLHYYMAVI